MNQQQSARRNLARNCRLTGAVPRPFGLNRAQPLYDEIVVPPVRPAMQRQGHQDRGSFLTRQKQTIAPEVVEAHRFASDFCEQAPEAFLPEDSEWQQMVALQSGVIARLPLPIDRAKADRRAMPIRLRSGERRRGSS